MPPTWVQLMSESARRQAPIDIRIVMAPHVVGVVENSSEPVILAQRVTVEQDIS